MRLEGKTALVTGGRRGIGAAIAARLMAEGAAVLIADLEGAETAAETLRVAGGKASGHHVDITDADSIAALAMSVERSHGHIDILVNNAGMGPRGMPPLARATSADFDAIFSVNARGTFFLTQAIAPLIVHGGRIVNISSASTRSRVPGLSLYAASKAAIDAFTRTWAPEFAPRRITVNAVLPGIVDTELLYEHMPHDLIKASEERVPFGRLGAPSDVADVVAFLCSEDARWISGQEIVVSGGA